MKQTEPKKKLAEWLRQKIAGLSVFWQSFLLLTVILALAAVTLVISSRRYTKTLTVSVLQQAESTFAQNCKLFSDALYNAYSVPATVENSADYTALLLVSRGELPQTAKSAALSDLQKTMKETLSLIRATGEAECFLYFPDCDAVCTRKQAFPAAADCFASYLCYEGRSAEQMLALLDGTRNSVILPESAVTVGGKELSCITLLVRPTGASSVLGVLFPKSTVLEYLSAGALPETSCFRLTASDGTVILSHGERSASEQYDLFENGLTGVRCSAEVGIPASYFHDLLRPTRLFSAALLGVTLAMGLALCLLFSGMGTLPLRQLLAYYSGEKNPESSRNEIRQLAELLASSHLQSEKITQILSVGRLTQVLSGSVLSREEEEKLLESYPMMASACRIAIVHSASPSEEMEQGAVTELLEEHLPESFVCSTVNGLETGVLLPDDADALSELAMVLSGVNSQLNVDGMGGLLCGVSASFTGVPMAYAAVRQARFAIPIRESSYLEVYAPEETDEVRPGVFSWLTHERLYHALMQNDRAETVEFIRALAADKYAPGDAKEVFYNVRFVVRSTANEMQMPLPEADSMDYHEEMRPKENFARLEELVCLLFDRLHARRETDADRTQENVVAYIAENFRDPELSAASAAAHFALPQKTVYAAVQAKTEMGFAEFLVSVRMKEAARLLCTTTDSVDDIASACGYPAQSTFYRVFKKYFGESPNRYRTLH